MLLVSRIRSTLRNGVIVVSYFENALTEKRRVNPLCLLTTKTFDDVVDVTGAVCFRGCVLVIVFVVG